MRTRLPVLLLALAVVNSACGARSEHSPATVSLAEHKAVLPGIAAGLVPLVFALCTNHMYTCGADGRSSLCVPACALGRVVAGLAIASVGNLRKAGPWFWVSASSLALLTGAMGCACIGYSGFIGLGVGFGAGMVPGLLRLAFGGKAT